MKRNLKKILINILLFGAFFVGLNLFFSCSPQQRLSRLVKYNPELLTTVQKEVPYMRVEPERLIVDTQVKARVGDTVRFSTASATGYIMQYDTIVRLYVKTKRDTIHDTIKVNVPQVNVIAKDKEKDYG
jgi:hypothetical protein